MALTLAAEKLQAFVTDRYENQAEAARAFGVSAPLMSMWLTGLRVPGRSNALHIEKLTRGRVPARAWDMPASDPVKRTA